MTYEPGVLVRRQQREYPQELRQEIALAALEVGNNREVARLYSEKLGYTVNESTVRGIKKRYLEGVHKGKLGSPGVSPRASGGEDSREGDEEEEEEEDQDLDRSFQPGDVMKLQLEVLEGGMKDSVDMEDEEDGMMEEDEDELEEETVEITKVNGEDSLVMNAAVLNGLDDDDEDDEHQLSIDTGEQEEEVPRPTIRVARGLVKEPSVPLTNGTKRKALATAVSLPVKKARPSVLETEQEMKELDKEVRALQWLARRKEQEWEQCVRLLKQKEERLLRCQRNKAMCLTETEHLLSKLQPVVVPQQQVLVLSTQPSSAALRTPARTIAPKPSPAAPTIVVKTRASPAKQQQQQLTVKEPTPPVTPSSGGETKFSHVLEKAGRNLAKATNKTKEEEGKGGKKEKVTPPCQGCGKKKSEFVCAGCSNRWYCSRECQVEDWDEHADDCSG